MQCRRRTTAHLRTEATANQVPIRSAPHVLPSQAPRACNGLAAVTLGGAYAAFPVRRVSPARLNDEVTFDGGMWGLVSPRGRVAPDVKDN